MFKPAAFITSVRLTNSNGLDGPHEYVTVWIRGANVGTLVVGTGDGVRLQELLAPGIIIEPAVSER
jgi:hypothetical protein